MLLCVIVCLTFPNMSIYQLASNLTDELLDRLDVDLQEEDEECQVDGQEDGKKEEEKPAGKVPFFRYDGE